ncbi:hypothetical protein [Pseudoalteromonas rhizosphaerae]|uniref:hypothetical protein n=1 Tax=Pseudoalteromonas rhizosphaerae TaxID=2518973 RepID=UPI00384D1942
MSLYIACIQNEEVIMFFGEGNTPDKAFKSFIESKLDEHCEFFSVEPGTNIEIGIYKAIMPDDPSWSDDFDPDWSWALGENVDNKKLTYAGKNQ